MEISQAFRITLLLLALASGGESRAADPASGDQRAVNVARLTYAQLLAQKDQLKLYIHSQETYAKMVKDAIVQNRRMLSEDDFDRVVLVRVENFSRDTKVTDTAVVDLLGKDIDTLVATYHAGQVDLLAEQVRLDAAFKDIAKLDQQYQELEQSLLRLSQPKQFRDQASNFSDFMVSAIKAYQAQQKADKSKENSSHK